MPSDWVVGVLGRKLWMSGVACWVLSVKSKFVNALVLGV